MTQPHDNWAQYYDFVYQQSYGNAYDLFTDETLNVINSILSGGSIIDFGAGTGRLTIPLANKGYNLIAVEKSIGMAEILKSKCLLSDLEVPIYNCSISEYNNGVSDLSLALFTVLSYSITEDELSVSIRNICKHIKPNGYFFFDLPSMQFFNFRELPFHRTPSCNRSVRIEMIGEDIYSYKEECTGIYNGEEFSYKDEFNIRYWNLNTLDRLLSENGLKDTKRSFPQFNSTGSVYKLYSK